MEYTEAALERLADDFIDLFGVATPFALLEIVPSALKNKLQPAEVILLCKALKEAEVVLDTPVGISGLHLLMAVIGEAKNQQTRLRETFFTTPFN